MAEVDPITSPHHKVAPPPQQKPITSFLSRAALFVAFAALLPFFPSQAPDFVNQTLLTRSWELLHLLLVGVAVSYGLFSHRNADPAAEKEALHGTESPQSYLTQLLQVSPVFDDEETPEVRPGGLDEAKLQMWNSRYHRGEPTVVVAQGDDDAVDGRRLILPVRSLRSRIPEAKPLPVKEEDLEAPPSPGNKEEEQLRAGSKIVLPSPIPWRSRSARMEVKGEPLAGAGLPSFIEIDASAFRTPPFRSPQSWPNSVVSSPRRLSPSPSISPEPRAMAGEDAGRRNILHSPPPVPPPPPSPPSGHKPPSFPSDGKEANRGDLGSPRVSRFHTRSRSHTDGYYPVGRSVRTVRPKEVSSESMPEQREITHSPASPVHKHRGEKESRKNGFKERVVVDSDESDGGEDSDTGDLPGGGAAADATAAEEEENEVDKKADEFIAKFREQIRQQRIESIKVSAGQRNR